MTQTTFNNLSLLADTIELESAFWFKKPTTIRLNGSVLRDAMAAIHENKNDKIRCVLTGAPYATIDSNQIRAKLQAIIDEKPEADLESVLDSWDLSLFALCSQASPTLRNRNDFCLRSLVNLPDGCEQVITYLFGKLFNAIHSRDNKGKTSAKTLVNRMHFTQATYDALTQIEDSILRKAVVRIALLDGWLGFEHWLRLSLIRGTSKALESFRVADHKELAAFFVDPDSLELNEDTLEAMIQSMQTIMVQTEVSFPGEAAGIAEATRESINVAHAVADALGIEPVGVKTSATKSHSAEEAEFIAYRDAITNKPISVAWSSTHGKGHVAGSRGPTPRAAAKADKPAKADKAKTGSTQRASRATTEKGKARAALKESLLNMDFNFDFKI